MSNHHDEIDIWEVVLILKQKIAYIIITMTIIGLLSSLFVWVMGDKVNITYSLSINKEPPGLIISCDNDFQCKKRLIFSEIDNDISELNINVDQKEKIINFLWNGDIRDSYLFKNRIINISQDVSNWIVDDYKRYNQLFFNDFNNLTINSDLYSRIILMTRSGLSKNENLVMVTEKVNKQYKPTIIILLSLIISFIAVSAYFIFKESFKNFKV